MKIGNSTEQNVSSSPFISTYEPIELPRNVDRLLVESHTVHSRGTSVDRGLERTVDRNEFTLTTIICSDSGDCEPWRSGSAMLVELWYESSPSLNAESLERSEQIALQISGAQYLASFIGSHEDSFGGWDWTITATGVPLNLVEETVRGSLRISGRDFPLPRELHSASLDEYWTNRLRIIGRYAD